jgi:hypothetical protein
MWRDADRREIEDRIGRLETETPARWGRMRAPQMVAHLTQSTRMATGELPVRAKRVFLRYPGIKHFAIYLMPFPKGLPTAPELLARVPVEWGTGVHELRSALADFARRPHNASWPDHPVFGAMTAGQWGALLYRHFDHHLRQFGV